LSALLLLIPCTDCKLLLLLLLPFKDAVVVTSEEVEEAESDMGLFASA
jgi:hypothetical protein